MTLNITGESLEVFLDYANDAGNWGGTVLVGGNVVGCRMCRRGCGTKAECGRRGWIRRNYLKQLKWAGLITTFSDEGEVWLTFTAEGKALAAKHGIEV